MIRKFIPVLAGVLLTCGAGLAQAQTGPSSLPSAPAAQVPSSPKQLTPEVLANYLRSQNYKVQDTKGSDGRTILKVQIEKQGWNFAIDVEYYPNQTGFYLLAPLGKAGSQNSSAQLAELLKANNKYAPAYFSIWPNGQLYMEDLYGTNMDTAQFQTSLNRFLAKVQESHPLWDSSRWPAQGQGVAQK